MSGCRVLWHASKNEVVGLTSHASDDSNQLFSDFILYREIQYATTKISCAP